MKTPRQIIAFELAGIYDDTGDYLSDYRAGKILDALYKEGYQLRRKDDKENEA